MPGENINRLKHTIGGLFAHPQLEGYEIGYMSDALSVDLFKQFAMEELTREEALEIIQRFDEDATLTEDAILTLPNLAPTTPGE